MSYNQSRAEKSDGQLRKTSDRSGQNIGFAGGGVGGKGGGGGGKGGGGGAPPHQPLSSGNRSYKKSSHGQGQSRINPAGLGSESPAINRAPRAVQNGAHGPLLSQGLTTTSMPGGPKPGDSPMPRTTPALPKPLSSQFVSGNSDSAAAHTPVKGDGMKPFALQFGTVSPGIVNGLQIPSRTSSAPPNLDEQKRDKARSDLFRAVPTQPIPSASMEQPRPVMKDVIGANQIISGESHPPIQVKREVHQQILIASVAPSLKPAAPPMPGISMTMPFQQQSIPLQFSGPGPQQMPMSLPIGNPPQVPQQMFVHNFQSHPVPPQAMIHQGQGIGFGPQISHQLGPQLGNLGIGITVPQFSQQPGKFGGARKTTSVKITHPDTHEEMRLDKSSYTDGVLLAQRAPNNITSQSQPITSFVPPHYFPRMQPNLYNPSPNFFPTGTPITTGSQPPRFSYPGGQSGQAVSFMNPSLMNNMPGSKSEPPVMTAPSAPMHMPAKPTNVPFGPKGGGPTVTISMPVSKADEPTLLKPPEEATDIHQKMDIEISIQSSPQQPEMVTQSQASVVSTQRSQSGTPSALDVPSGDSGSVVLETDCNKKEPIRRTDSFQDHQKKSSQKKLRPSQQQQQETDECASGTMVKLSSQPISNDDSSKDVKTGQLIEGIESIHESLSEDMSTTTTATSLPSCSTEHSVSTVAITGETVESKRTPVESGSSGVIRKLGAPPDIPMSYSDYLVAARRVRIPIKGKGFSEESSSSGPELDENTSKNLDSAVCYAGNACLEVECRLNMSAEFEKGQSAIIGVSADNINVSVHSGPTVIESESSEALKLSLVVEQKESTATNLEKVNCGTLDSIRQRVSSHVERALDAIDIQAMAVLEPKKAIRNDKDMPPTPHAMKDELGTACTHDVGSIVPGLSHLDAAPESPVTFERANKSEAYVTEDPKVHPVSYVTSDSRDMPSLESTKAKPITGKKKKRREILSKADAAGTSDLYNAYKGPEEKQQLTNASKSEDSPITVDRRIVNAVNPDNNVVASKEDAQSKAEVDDWEDAADISTPKLENGKKVTGDGSEATGKKKYTRDFLLTFSEQCIDLPVGFEIGSDIADALMSVQLVNSHVVDHNPYPSPGWITDRSPGVSQGDCYGIGMMDGDRWKAPGPFPLRDIAGQNFHPGPGATHGVLRNPRGQPPNQFFPVISGPMQSLMPQGGPIRNNSDADRWRSHNNSIGLMPPQMPLQVMHKTENKYEVGKVSDKEQAKQRQLKGILNKLTPQNFEKLFQQVKDVNIDNTVTLSGVISQIFDKALMEPTFCEMYADFCFHLSGVLPDFMENDEKITFKRLLLNKCQEEFERGEREEAEANRVEEEGEIKQSEQEREEKRIKARRRMLGNIRLIGELFKKKMLTERIMHECIQKLLGQHQNPDEEDLEALCKLMSTIGDQIDHAKAKVYMNAYFDGMLKLSTNQKISSRVRFMLRDVIDLRKNRWQQRRKVEGPKKIEEVHRDAAQERQSQTSRLTRGPSTGSGSRRGQDYGPWGSSVLSSSTPQIGGIRGLSPQVRGYDIQDARLEAHYPLENRTLSLPLSQRPIDHSSITLGPQGGLARGMSIRCQPSISSFPLAETPQSIGHDRRMTPGPNGYNSTPKGIPYNPREDTTLRYMPDRLPESSFQDRNSYASSRELRIADHLRAGRTQGSIEDATSVAKPLSEEVLREKSITTIREFYSAKDEKEVALCIKELNSPSFHPSMVSLWVTDSFERKDMERDLLATLLVNLCKSQDSLLSQVQLSQGVESVLSLLEDAVNDAPRATEFLGRILIKVILENVVSLKDIGELIHKGGEEPGSLLESGLASEVLGSVLEIIRAEKGESIMKEILASSNLWLEDFRPPHPMKAKKLEAFL